MNESSRIMKPILSPSCSAALAAAALLFCGLTLNATDKPATPASKSSKGQPVVTNAAPVSLEIPKSVFIIPKSPAEGKDPFYPKSTRLFNTVVIAASVTTTSAPVSVQVDLQLKGISGTADHRLAIIGTRTFEQGEEHEMPSASGRVRIRCVEIASDSVIVQVGNEQRTLHLRPGI